jgi:DNA repair protein RecO
VRPAHRLQQDLDGILLGSYLAEHMTVFVQENEDSELAFRLLDSTLEALLAGVDRDLAARFYEAWVLRLAGIFPAPTECPACGRSLEAGAVLPPGEDFLVCESCAAAAGGGRGLSVPADVLAFLVRIGRERLGALAGNPPSPPVLRRAEALAARVRRRFLDRDLKSYDMIQTLSS